MCQIITSGKNDGLAVSLRPKDKDFKAPGCIDGEAGISWSVA